MSSINSLDLAQLFIKNIFSKHCLPSSSVSDRGPLFVSSFWTNLCQQLNISRDLSTAYHPEADGKTERVNQIIEQYLWIIIVTTLCHNAVCQTSAKGTLAKKAIKPVERPVNTGK
ncbi:hypothetical protein O181_064564, partial [Austropuccinia psidii MF-1]|nr:hypothetical protein [Austropuccinia psidii MF-1]